jgi:leucyl-tRNA synthetase
MSLLARFKDDLREKETAILFEMVIGIKILSCTSDYMRSTWTYGILFLNRVVWFQNKVYYVVQSTLKNSGAVTMDSKTTKILHKTIKKVTEDIENMSFNTAISAMMVLTNHLVTLKDKVPREAVEKLILMVSPFAPHLGEECWSLLGHEESLAYHPWVDYDEALCVDDSVRMGVQVNGKTRGEIKISKDASQDEAMAEAMKVQSVFNQVDGKDVRKINFVQGRILNIIVAQ